MKNSVNIVEGIIKARILSIAQEDVLIQLVAEEGVINGKTPPKSVNGAGNYTRNLLRYCFVPENATEGSSYQEG